MKILLIPFVFMLGCSTTRMDFIPGADMEYFQPKNRTQIQVFYSEPKSEFKSLGFIDFDLHQPGFSSPMLSDVLPDVQGRAANLGADAIIIRRQDNTSVTNRQISGTAEVIKFTK